MLVDALGGCCAKCGATKKLEINHVDGCTWIQRRVSSHARLLRYLNEYRAGVRLNVLCRSCNAGLNQHVYGTRKHRATKAEVVEELERREREGGELHNASTTPTAPRCTSLLT
jgi:hypothetical protein